jgi:hypothetical protein
MKQRERFRLGDGVEGVPLKCPDTSGIRHACTIGIEFDAVPAKICLFCDEIKSDSLPHSGMAEAGSANTFDIFLYGYVLFRHGKSEHHFGCFQRGC